MSQKEGPSPWWRRQTDWGRWNRLVFYLICEEESKPGKGNEALNFSASSGFNNIIQAGTFAALHMAMKTASSLDNIDYSPKETVEYHIKSYLIIETLVIRE